MSNLVCLANEPNAGATGAASELTAGVGGPPTTPTRGELRIETLVMCDCQKYAERPPHTCPFAEEVRGDLTECTCCADCESLCAEGI